jgi:GT2 family glycosyltransferase
MDDFADPDAASRAAAVAADVGAVVIGRNEGARLVACLASLRGISRLVYVDSGSSDGSVAAARAAGAQVIELDLARPFTAARARNAGLAALAADPPAYVQFVDGDCVLRDGWIDTARAFLDTRPKAAVACGRRRERYPGASVYNRLCDREWDTPVGPAAACGGDALARFEAVQAAGGFRESLIAGEEPELCLRLRRAGWEIWRLDAEMTWHDAAMTRFGHWWRRSRRAGHAFAEGAALHGRPPERHWVAESRRALAWGVALPALALALTALTPFGLLLLLAYPGQVLRLAVREGPGHRAAWERAFFLTLARFPEALGVLGFHLGRRGRLIEYK